MSDRSVAGKPCAALVRAILGAALALACSDAPSARRPRLVVLYATCTLNKSFLGPYTEGAKHVEFTPNLDRLAREGVVFERHQTEADHSGISFASIFTGAQADVHGIYYHPNRLRGELFTITEAFAEAGYEPWFWSGQIMASYDLNYGQGVASERVFQPKAPDTSAQKRSLFQPENALFRALLARLETDPDYRAFALVNFSVTHGAYHRQLQSQTYEAFLRRFPGVSRGITRDELERWWRVYEENRRGLEWDFPRTVERLGLSEADVEALARVLEWTYAADVWALDGMLGRALEELERHSLLDQTLFAFTADHGEVLHRPNALFHWTHGLQLAPEELDVPWIVRAPGLGLAPRRQAGVTRSIDVFPTLAGLVGMDVEGRGPRGRNLAPALLSGEDLAPELAYSHTTTLNPLRLEDFRKLELRSRFFDSADVGLIWTRIRDGDRVYKLRNLDGERWGVQAFDLASDPWEERDLFDPGVPEHAAMARRLEAYKALLVQGFGSASIDAPEDALQRLRALGYVADPPAPPREDP